MRKSSSKLVKSSESKGPIRAIHPWYYIPGRKDLTELNISSRREREAQQHQQYVNNDKYFNKYLAQNQVFNHWNDNKSLVKNSNKFHSSKPPFDTIEPKTDSNYIRRNKKIEKKFIESEEKLSKIMVKFNKLNEEYIEFEKNQNILISQLIELKNIKISINEKKEFCELKEKRLFYVRFGREKLRQKVFEICNQLICYKIAIQSIQSLNIGKELLNNEEFNQMSEVNERAIKILDMYIKLNQNRDTEFQLMYHEEGEKRWLSQELEWKQEYQVWNDLMEKLIDSYETILKDKLSHILTAQKSSLKEREQHLTELSSLTTQLKSDHQLSIILSQDINTFIENKNK